MTPLVAADPFDLPDWLGTDEVAWSAASGLRGGHRVHGVLRAGGGTGEQRQACDLLAVDLAHPAPVVADDVRVAAHQAWSHGQVLVALDTGTVVLAVPGSSFTADLALEALARLALAVGASPERWAVHLRIGRDQA